MTLMHSLGQDDQNEVLLVFGHMTSLTLAWASQDADGIINCAITFLR